MAEVLVRRCSVHVVLPRPWGWASRHRLSEAIVRYVIDIVLPQLAAVLTTSSTRGSVERLQVDVRLPASAILPGAPGGGAPSRSLELTRLTRAALDALSFRVIVTSPTPGSATHRPDATTGAELQVHHQGALPSDRLVAASDRNATRLARALAAFFSRMAQDGRLVATLTAADPEYLRRWVDVLRSGATSDGRSADGAKDDQTATLRDDVQEELTRLGTSAGSAEPEVVRLVLVTALPRRAGRTTPTGDIWAAADAAVSRLVDRTAWQIDQEQASSIVPAVAPVEPTARASALPPPGTGVAPESTRQPGDVAAPRTDDRGTPAGEVVVRSALPFLLLGPLDEFGVLDATVAALAGAGLEAAIDAYATALAYKVLPPPALGWLRAPEDDAVAAAYAGRQVPVDAGRLERLAGRADEWSPMIDAVIRDARVDGHDAVAPLAVSEREDGLVVADADGIFPMLWGASPGDLARLRADLGLPAVVDDVDAGTVRRLSAIADALDARPSGRSLPPRFERHLDLCASFALATITWRLWREEEAGPLLALERFADLDAVVRLTDDAVVVRLPMGRRTADLRDAGLLRPVVDVPWLGGRTVELSEG
jgi:hypothetical protein